MRSVDDEGRTGNSRVANILASSPLTSGQLKFIVNIRKPRPTPVRPIE